MPNRFDKVNANQKRADDEKPASEFTRSQPCRFFDSDGFSGAPAASMACSGTRSPLPSETEPWRVRCRYC